MIAISITVGITGTYVWIADVLFSINTNYYVIQFISYGVMFLVAGIVHNITRLRYGRVKEQYDRLNVSEELLRQTLISVGDGVMTVNKDGRIDFLNPVAAALIGLSANKVKGASFMEVFHVKCKGKQLDVNLLLVVEERTVIGIDGECTLESEEGKISYIEMTAAPIKKEDGSNVGIVIAFRDVTEKNKERKQIIYMSYHDQLTGLYNRHFFAEELKRFDKNRQLPLSMIFADINGLKHTNDTFGHEMGDQLIIKVAELLTLHFRDGEIISRVGGDEFIVLLPKTKKIIAEEKVVKIRETMKDKVFMNFPISVSFGIASKVDREQRVNEILTHAEQNMYEDKRLNSPFKR